MRTTVKLASGIGSLSRVSAADGSRIPVTIGADRTVAIELAIGDGALFELNEAYDYEAGKTAAKGENLALKANVGADSSVGNNGFYINKLNDGVRTTKTAQKNCGWRSFGKNTALLTVDFGKATDFNRIDLYPYGENRIGYAEGLPKDFTVEVSTDGKTYTTVATHTDFALSKPGTPESLAFERVNARYIRIPVTAFYSDYMALAELEIYDDDGTVPVTQSPFPYEEQVIAYTPDMNLALGREAGASSSVPDSQRDRGWAIDFICNGKTNDGWSSAANMHTTAASTEWVAVDLGDLFAVDRVRAFCRDATDAFPINFQIQLSRDLLEWKTVKTVSGDRGSKGWRDYRLSEAEPARYVRIYGTRLVNKGADGYMMQVAELEAYGTPIVDFTAANALVTRLEEADEQVAEKVAASLGALKEGLQNKNITQTGLNALVKAAQQALEDATRADGTAARALLDKIANSADRLEGKDTAALDSAVAALQAALQNAATTQTELDALTEAAQTELDKLLPEEKANKKCGCSSSVGFETVAAALLPLFGVAVCLVARRRKTKA